MGIFEYLCSFGHLSQRLRPSADRLEPVKCEHCGAPATFIVSATKTIFHANDRKAIKREGR